jgi:hypothetical protein
VGDAVTVNATGTFADKNVATGKTVTLTSGYTGADVGNYSITNQANTTADITARALAVNAAGVNKVYDRLLGATVTLSDDRVAGDVLTTAYSTANYLDKNVATGKTVNVSGITVTGTDAGNYTFNTTAATTASINQASLNVSGITAGNKVYDGNTTATVNTTGASYGGLLVGDAVTVNATGTFADKNVATGKTVTLTSSYTGADVGNYSITNQDSTTANINAKALNVAGITASNKVYDRTTAATVNTTGASYTGLVAGDVLNVSATGVFSDKNVATGKTVTLTSSYTGADVGNYSITNQDSTTANITARALAVNAAGVNKVYDRLIDATATLSDDRVAGDVLTTAYTTASFLDKNVANGKTVNVSGITVTGTDAGNYTANTTAATTANITAKALILTGITAGNKVYDGNTTATVSTSGANYNGLIVGDAVTVNATGTFADKNVATGKTVTLTSSNTGADVGNYSITSQANTTANITAAALTASIVGSPSKVYDGTTAATLTSANYSLGGFVAGEGATVGQTVGTFNSPNVLTANSVSATLATGNFAANAGTLLNNYLLPTTASGAGSITPAGLSATANAATHMTNRYNFSGTPGTLSNGGSYVITPSGLYSTLYNISYTNNVLTALSSPSQIDLTGGVYESWYGVWRSYKPRLQAGL